MSPLPISAWILAAALAAGGGAGPARPAGAGGSTGPAAPGGASGPGGPAPEEAEVRPPIPLSSATWVLPGAAMETPLRRDGESTVEPQARFRVEAGAPLADARLALYDAQESMVPVEEEDEIGSAASRYQVTPSRPLRPGARYTLRLEGAAGRTVRDLDDRRYRPISFSVLVAGQAPADRPAKKGAKKTARRRRS